MKKVLSVVVVLVMLLSLMLTFGHISSFAYSYWNGTMKSAQTVYCLPGGGMTIGSVSKNEVIKLFWKEGAYYYIEYTVSSGNYSGYKRGYVPISSVSTSYTIGNNSFTVTNAGTVASKTVYNRGNTASMVIGTVYASDAIQILNVEGTWCYIQYPVSGGNKRGYILINDIKPSGNLEAISFSKIAGWAWNPAMPNTPISITLTIQNNSTGYTTSIGTTASKSRADLLQAGIGNGAHGFDASINWSNLPSGVYSINAKAQYGAQQQVGPTLTYDNTSTKNSVYLYTEDNTIPTYTQGYVSSFQGYYSSLGLVGTQAAGTYSAMSIAGFMSAQNNKVTTIQGHGGPGWVSIKATGLSDHLLVSNFDTGSNLDFPIASLSAGALSNSDIIAFLSCNSATSPSISQAISLTQAVLNKGVKVTIGFAGEVMDPEVWYEKFVKGLNYGMNCYEAFLYAQDAANTTISDLARQNVRIYRAAMI